MFHFIFSAQQHEVVAASEKVVLRLDDLVSWITDVEVEWLTGLEVPLTWHSDPPSWSLTPFQTMVNNVISQKSPVTRSLASIQQTDLDEKLTKNGKLIPERLNVC